MTRAMRRKADMYNDYAGTEVADKSFLSLSSSCISAKLSSVGFVLGKNNDKIDISTKALKRMEYERLTVTPKVSAKSSTPPLDEDELHDTIDVQLLSHLVGDVSEGGLDEAMLSSAYDLKASSRKSKSESLRKKKSPKKKVKFPTSPLVSR